MRIGQFTTPMTHFLSIQTTRKACCLRVIDRSSSSNERTWERVGSVRTSRVTGLVVWSVPGHRSQSIWPASRCVQSWTSKVNQSLKFEYIGKEWIIWQFYCRFLVGFAKYVKKHTSEVFPTSGLGWPKFRPKISKLLTTTEGQICVSSHL